MNIEFDIDLPLEFKLIPIEEFEESNDEVNTSKMYFWTYAANPNFILQIKTSMTNLQLIKLLREKTKEHNANN